MGSYILNFIVYTLAMSGLICTALVIYKKVMLGGMSSKGSSNLKIEETMSINPRKCLMIVRAGDERFLIASDVDKTTLISKLGQDEEIKNIKPEVASSKSSSTVDISKELEQIYQAKNSSITHINQPIRLETINSQNPDITVLRKRRNSYVSRNHRRNISEIEVGKSRNHGFSTMKELASKVNEL